MSDTLVGALIAGAVSVIGYLLVFRVNRKTATTDAAQRQIDQIQEDRAADRDQFDKAASKFDARQRRLETRIELMESRERSFSDYVLTLRWHIAEGQPPPPPAFPPELLRPLDPDRSDR